MFSYASIVLYILIRKPWKSESLLACDFGFYKKIYFHNWYNVANNILNVNGNRIWHGIVIVPLLLLQDCSTKCFPTNLMFMSLGFTCQSFHFPIFCFNLPVSIKYLHDQTQSESNNIPGNISRKIYRNVALTQKQYFLCLGCMKWWKVQISCILKLFF